MAFLRAKTADVSRFVYSGDPDVAGGGEPRMVPYAEAELRGSGRPDVFHLRPMNQRERLSYAGRANKAQQSGDLAFMFDAAAACTVAVEATGERGEPIELRGAQVELMLQSCDDGSLVVALFQAVQRLSNGQVDPKKPRGPSSSGAPSSSDMGSAAPHARAAQPNGESQSAVSGG